MHLNYNNFQHFRTGDLLYRGNQDIAKVIRTFFSIIIDTPVNFVHLFVILVVLFYIDVYLASISLGIFLIKTLYTFGISNKFNHLNLNVKESESFVLDAMKQIVDKILFIKLNRLYDHESQKFDSILSTALEEGKRLHLFRSFHGGISSILSILQQMVTLSVGAYLISNNVLTIGLLLSFITVFQKVAGPIEYFSSLIFTIKDVNSSYQRISPLLRNDSLTRIKFIEDKNSDVQIRCDNVTLRQGQHVILRDINFQIRKGEKVALWGSSGSGKSSLCKLLAGIYDFDGTVLVNTASSSIPFSMGFILDESSVFKGTLRENLTYGINRNVPEYELLEALELSGLHDFCSRLSNGLDSQIQPDKLSHGEKQRIELARMFLVKPDILILDEATSGLDEEMEQKVWENIRRVFNDRTIIFITHNHKIISDKDRCIFISNSSLTLAESKNEKLKEVHYVQSI
jgi:ABC-type bacteriocin/lantibiotic exporter with double-glycine peptidase domain